ncbi:class I SAM-dependent methyltransferase [Synechococcus sp. CS-1325]|uniref:class I SAM-dependent methyltransferase n=1 Tax=Synechococcus sp. CS-1325 TaxID=2847979 RepID=UPI00223B49A5|nr:class I SAM-dependent methyltransferase [Synechococcus sp. CS-1325]MCT0199210.1 class I SAM-dependent methyltransferase [Synechococcus sp. CS-1325]
MVLRPQVIVSAPSGSFPDDLDCFQMNGYEDPGEWEAAMKRAFIEARSDAEVAQLLRTHYLEENVAASFVAYRESGVPEAVDGLLKRLGLSLQTPVADIGCGRGHAAHAMARLGYEKLTAMDPNDEWYTGTGFLRSLDDHNIRIVNHVDEWGKLGGSFGAIISSGTVHHWHHIPQIAIDTRRAMQPGGYWLMIAEYFANSARDLVDGLNSHPTATRYGSFEWAYPASAYVDLIQASGFLLVGVIPLHYRGALFYSGCELPFDDKLDQWVDANLTLPGGTVEEFWSEVDAWRRGIGVARNYTVPQVLIFKRVQI